MQIDPYQSVSIFGWWRQPRLTLTWEDVKQRGLSWRNLRALNFEPEELRKMQPDKMEWIQRGGLLLTDIPEMMVFPVNPLTDFRADLAELWNLRCAPGDLVKMGVTYTQLLNKGLNSQIMYYFNFTVHDWAELGMTTADVQALGDADCLQIFGIRKDELVKIMQDFGPRT
jgi:hypothetical protein